MVFKDTKLFHAYVCAESDCKRLVDLILNRRTQTKVNCMTFKYAFTNDFDIDSLINKPYFNN